MDDQGNHDMKLSLGELLRENRTKRGWTQEETARHIGSSQSRVAKMEAADRSVSLDLLVRSLLKVGVCPDDLVGGFRGARANGPHARHAVTR